jgi:hypothetical protein
LTFDGSICQTLTTPTKWSFEGPVKVDKKSEALVLHKVREISTATRAKFRTTITATKDVIPVYIRNRLTGKSLDEVFLQSNALGRIFKDVKGFKEVGSLGNCIEHECIADCKIFDSAEHYIEVVTKPLKSESETEIGENQSSPN